MRMRPGLILATGLIALAGCYSSGEQMGANDPRTPQQPNSSGRSSAGQGNDPAPAPAHPAVPGPGTAVGSAGAAPEVAPGTAPAQTPPPQTAPATP